MFGMITGILAAKRAAIFAAVADAGVVNKNGPTTTSGNVYDNDSNARSSQVRTIYWTDPQSQVVTSYAPGSSVSGLYGSLTVQVGGEYTYSLNSSNPAVIGLYQGETLTDVFSVDSVDAYGRSASSQLTITVQGYGSSMFVGMVTLATKHVDARGLDTPAPVSVVVESRATNARGLDTPAPVGVTLFTRGANARGQDTPAPVGISLATRSAGARGLDAPTDFPVSLSN
jgi:VCBS repeat-containing protein